MVYRADMDVDSTIPIARKNISGPVIPFTINFSKEVANVGPTDC